MRLIHRRVYALIFLSVFVVSQTACPKNHIREAAKASDRMATLIGSAIDLKRQLGQLGPENGGISPAEELALTNHLLTANTRIKQFNDFARTKTEDSPQTRLDLANAFNQVTNAINLLSNQAIFPIKDPEAKKKLLAILNSINVSVQIIDAALRG